MLEGCVLEIISRGSTYGYQITRTLNNLGFSEVVEGTVYTILLRLEKHGLVYAQKAASDKGPPRNFFTLTPKGDVELKQFWQRWEFLSSKINQLKG